MCPTISDKRTKRVMIDLVNMIVAVLCLSLAAYNFSTGQPLDASLLMGVGLFNALILFWHPEKVSS